MNRNIPFVEFKSPDHPELAEVLVRTQLKKINLDPEQSAKDWAVYANDQRFRDVKRKVRPRSKMLLVNQKAEPPELKIVFENKQLVVLNKPSGLPTQATLKAFEDNLYERVRLHYILEKDFPGGLPYVGLHHRLDRGTSGLVLMTKQRSANKEVADLFKHHKIEKRYMAITEWGETQPAKKWQQQDKIKRGSAKKKKFFFQVDSEGDLAVTHFELLESGEGEWHKFLCLPKTGRTHQLRVQLAHKGYPILGDPVYGQKSTAKRLMLHAEVLKFSFKGEDYDLKCPIHW